MSFQGGEHEIKLFGDFDARGGLLLIEAPSIDFAAPRQPGERAEAFEDRAVAALRDLRSKALAAG